jgi:hypothetical protein
MWANLSEYWLFKEIIIIIIGDKKDSKQKKTGRTISNQRIIREKKEDKKV